MITASGTSNVRDWDAQSADIEGSIEIVDGVRWETIDAFLKEFSAGEMPEIRATVRIPARTLTSGSRRLTSNMHDYMDVTDHPYITFELTSIEHLEAENAEFTHAKEAVLTRVTGDLTVSGQTRETSIPVAWKRTEDALRLSGETELKMSDFGIEPPTMMLGALRTADEVTVAFNWFVAPKAR